MRVGDTEITPLVDGTFTAPDGFFGPGSDLSTHAELLDADGRLRLPIGCFLVRHAGRSVLVDAGVGPVAPTGVFEGGHLLEELAAAGVSPQEIDTVVCSHLHLDHCGWLVDGEGEPLFPAATLWVGAGDWHHFVDSERGDMRRRTRAGLRAMLDTGRVELVDGDTVVAPGVTAVAAPGHTPGHLCMVVSSGDERAILLGDAITCPVQLDETGWAAISDVDPALATATRERLWRELEAPATLGTGAHFPALSFGRVLTGSGRRWWT